MATDLEARATKQETALGKAAGAIADALADARTERDRRHAKPDTVPIGSWGKDLGAVQHQDHARLKLAANGVAQAKARAALAAVNTAGDAATYEAILRGLQVEEAGLRVELRAGQERVAAVDALIDAVAGLGSAADAEKAAAKARTAWAHEHQKLGAELRGALTKAPLSGLAAAATAVKAGAGFTAAGDRLKKLPDELRLRAADREDEAAAAMAAAAGHLATAQKKVDGLVKAELPTSGTIDVATRVYLDAEDELRRFVAGAATELGVAESLLARVAAHPDLSAAQVTALKSTADRAAAVKAEHDLAVVLAKVAAAERDVEDAVLTALGDDPDTDPDTVQAVIDAKKAAGKVATDEDLAGKRAGYGDAVRATLDKWEVEVPPSLWDAVADFHLARRILDRLSAAATATNLVSALDAAQDALATALDLHDVGLRKTWAVAMETTLRRSAFEAATATAGDRRAQYVRGDGPGGRTRTEL